MEEPTVLDYVKEKLHFWKKGTLAFPTEVVNQIAIDGAEGELPAEPASFFDGSTESTAERIYSILRLIPKWSLLALFAALFGQMIIERTHEQWQAGFFLYVSALGLVGIAIRKNEWNLTPIPSANEEFAPIRITKRLFFVILPLVLLTFLLFGNGKFNFFNASLWILSVVLTALAFIQNFSGVKDWLGRVKDKLSNWPIRVNISGWSILVLVSFCIILFFRFYNLTGVPLEMTSDHAEKLMDVQDVIDGNYSVYFERNTGREAFQFYLTAFISQVFHTGITFLSLKLGTALAGIAIIPYMYFLGKELGNRRVGLLVMFLCGIAYWPNVISRVGLRFPLYPLFVAPMLYYILRGLRTKNVTDFIWAGIALGLGLHGYSPFRIVPFFVVIIFILYAFHQRSSQKLKFSTISVIVIAVVSLVVFIPLMRYMIDHLAIFNYRALSRVGEVETAFPGNPFLIFLSNSWKAMTMFAYDDGNTWLHSVTNRPALDVVGAALFYIGYLLILVRYIRQRNWQDLMLIIAIPFLMLPSTLSIAFPIENPSLNRTGGAIIPVFLIIGLALDGFMHGVEEKIGGKSGKLVAAGLALFLCVISVFHNYSLVFDKYRYQVNHSAGNTTEMAKVLKDFKGTFGSTDNAWIVGYPYWVDTRLPSIVNGERIKDYAIWPDQFEETLQYAGPKLFIFNKDDTSDLGVLHGMYPQGYVTRYKSAIEDRDFLIMVVLPENE